MLFLRRGCCTLALFALILPSRLHATENEYVVYLVCEAGDQIVRARFGPTGARIEKEISTAVIPSDISGPHGIAVAPDRSAYYVTLGHGRPFGSVQKYATPDDKLRRQTTLGMFPATADVTPDGNFLFVVNFNLHGDMVPSSVSVVETAGMAEIARIPTCVMPHGSRVNLQGTRQYSACMMDDLLVEVDTNALRVSRTFRVTRGAEEGFSGLPQAHSSAHAMPNACSPTWAQPATDGGKIYVACNKSNEIVELDAGSWRSLRRIPARDGVYNLAVTSDDRLVATNKRDASVSVFDLKTGTETARVITKGKVVHGVVVSPDNRYAFITTEGVGMGPGTVEMLDLRTLRMAETLDVAPQAAGIAFWKTEAAGKP
jgi:DNA-binding beta-propeller fold protein YncE